MKCTWENHLWLASIIVQRLMSYIVDKWQHKVTKIWVNIGSGNGLLPDVTEPLPEPMLTYHQWGPVALFQRQFHINCSRIKCMKEVWRLHFKNSSHVSGATSWLINNWKPMWSSSAIGQHCDYWCSGAEAATVLSQHTSYQLAVW